MLRDFLFLSLRGTKQSLLWVIFRFKIASCLAMTEIANFPK